MRIFIKIKINESSRNVFIIFPTKYLKYWYILCKKNATFSSQKCHINYSNNKNIYVVIYLLKKTILKKIQKNVKNNSQVLFFFDVRNTMSTKRKWRIFFYISFYFFINAFSNNLIKAFEYECCLIRMWLSQKLNRCTDSYLLHIL